MNLLVVPWPKIDAVEDAASRMYGSSMLASEFGTSGYTDFPFGTALGKSKMNIVTVCSSTKPPRFLIEMVTWCIPMSELLVLYAEACPVWRKSFEVVQLCGWTERMCLL